MPLWKELCAEKEKRANLVSMEASTYAGTEMSEKKEIDGVPTVLFVDKEGSISEAESPRDKIVMTNAVRKGVSEKEARSGIASDVFTPVSAVPATVSEEAASELISARVPGVRVTESPLEVLPSAPVSSEKEAAIQTGGNPWAAFIMAARQAAPAAVLLGAYSLTRRSTRRRRRVSRRKGKKGSRRS